MSDERLTITIDLRLAGYRGGGIARYATELARELARVPELRVVPLVSRRDITTADGRRLWTPPHHRFEQHTIAGELALRRLRPAVYHATDFIAPRLRGTAIVATVHDLAFVRWPDDLAPEALAPPETQLCHHWCGWPRCPSPDECAWPRRTDAANGTGPAGNVHRHSCPSIPLPYARCTGSAPSAS